MRLLNSRTFKFKTFFDESRPKYAILSHRWTDEETTLQEFATQAEALRDIEREEDFRKLDQKCASMRRKTSDYQLQTFGSDDSYDEKVKKLEILVLPHCSPGVGKVWRFCKLASHVGYEWVWVDTCCIDKSSSAELTEAINSMFSWYANSDYCCAYLNDVSKSHNKTLRIPPWLDDWAERWGDQLRKSKWFSRGWTLQELLAPRKLCFYDMSWRLLGERDHHSVRGVVSDITHIRSDAFGDVDAVRRKAVGLRMSWVSLRQTSRVEDMAYCMLGILDIYMPLIYGEGWNAFRRLQEELIARNPDETIFCWNLTEKAKHTVGVLATRPEQFSWIRGSPLSRHDWFERAPHRITNKGLQFEVFQPRDADGSVFEHYIQPDDDEERQRALLVPLNVRSSDGRWLCLTMRDVNNNFGVLGKLLAAGMGRSPGWSQRAGLVDRCRAMATTYCFPADRAAMKTLPLHMALS